MCAGVGAATADADPLPPMPGDQNQLPELPSESDVYPFFPLPTPADDPWYTDPENLDSMANGDIVRSRDVQHYMFGLPWPVATRQILYRSTNSHDQPIVTATTVLTPGIPWAGGPRPLVSYQEAIDGLAQVCNPSYTLRAGTFKESSAVQSFLVQGYAVAIPDFNGKTNAYLSTGEGHMVLDGIRAAQRDPALGLANSPVALLGYSGGASGTGFAAEQHHNYAPELNIVGAAFGGIPGDKVGIAEFGASHAAGQANFTLWLAVVSLSREYPEVFGHYDEFLTPEGVALANDMNDRCLYTGAATGAFRPMSGYLRDPDFLRSPEIRSLLENLSFGQPQNRPDIPLFTFHSTTDQLLPFEAAYETTLQKYCAMGVDVRFYPVPVSEHISGEVFGYVPATLWVTAVLRGVTPEPSNCPAT
ncbi:triacylglycerol lipase [Antrihabitans sp. YC2-6]|nr:triacylglycerol lipase [Antrihabitans sp. YC2-6]